MSNERDLPGTDDADSANKRAALAGQWRTPPMPAYAATYTPGATNAANATHQSMQQSHMPESMAPSQNIHGMSAPTHLPGNSADYAKALQEAYRKGAEAAALMAQQQIPATNSCPNFSSGQNSGAPTQALNPEEAAYQAHQVQTTSHSAVPDHLSSTMPPPPPQMQHPQVQQQHPPQAPSNTNQPAPGSAHVSQTSSEYAASAQHSNAKASQGRSMSMPDMSAYAAKAEEEKRQKRLARNRASARLRRLRKKNLVDAYETEVGILEKTLKQLKAHEWGKDDDHKALLDALGMERGQQAIQPDQRTAIIKDILNQQMQQVQLLRQTQMEQECLAMMADDGNADDDIAKELQELLQLTDTQKQELRVSSQGLNKEVEALETVAASLQVMQENDWLLNEGVQGITDQYTSILHKNQLSKLLMWTDANVEAIDQLDHVQVQPLQAAPVFAFGVETTPVDDEEGK